MFFTRMLTSTEYMLLIFIVILLVVSGMIISWSYARQVSGFSPKSNQHVSINLASNQTRIQ